MIQRIDDAILAAHQWLVDATQVSPKTLQGWFFHVGAIAALARGLLVLSRGPAGVEWLAVLGVPLIVAAMAMCRMLPAAMHKTARLQGFRMASVALALFCGFPPYDAATPLRLALDICFAAMMYLGMCDQPKPPARKPSSKARLA